MKCNIWKLDHKEPLPDLLSFVVDNRGKTVPTAENGHILIATNCITNDTLYPVYEKVRYLNDDTFNTFFRAHPVPGDIIFVNKGTPGRVCMVPDPVDFCIAQDMIALRADDKKIYNKYLFAVLRSEKIQTQIFNTTVGDVIPHYKKQFMDQILIPIPDRTFQEYVGDLYYDFSLKIHLNSKKTANLLSTALVLYKKFVFGKEKNGTIGDLIVDNGKSKIQVGKARGVSGQYPFFTSGKSILEYGEKLVDGRNIYLNTGGVADVKFYNGDASYSTDTWCIKGKSKYTCFLFLVLLSKLREIEETCFEGSALRHLQKDKLKETDIFIPSESELDELNSAICPMLDEMSICFRENRKLRETRDSLTKRIFSGLLEAREE